MKRINILEHPNGKKAKAGQFSVGKTNILIDVAEGLTGAALAFGIVEFKKLDDDLDIPWWEELYWTIFGAEMALCLGAAWQHHADYAIIKALDAVHTRPNKE